MSTSDFYRPDPDALLAAVQKDESRQQRGRLKIFFGMAAGVGKTYSMLDAARRLKDSGTDVVIGIVETHKRAETEALIDDLEIIPRKQLPYRDTLLEEMDIDAILARKPALVLIDELAHTNVPGSRHPKRWQDVVEVLDAGIDVWTTVNVQHFESRADAVAQITGIRVQETVPDSLLDLADEIELIDLSPEDLRKRLAEGKVYLPERIETAANNFFRTGNLTALREMSLRLTAEHVDHKLQDYMQVKHIAGPWKSSERLMVGVSSNPFSEKLIRWTRRVAYNLEAPWVALSVETSHPLSQEAKETLAQNLALARELGGEVVTAADNDVVGAMLRIAHQRNVTQIVVGKPIHNRLQTILKGGSVVNHLIHRSGDIDIYVVTGDDQEGEARSTRFLLPQGQPHSSWQQYLYAFIIIALLTLAELFLLGSLPLLTVQTVGLADLFAVLLIAVYLGRGPALLAAALSASAWNFLFIEPRFTFAITELEDIVIFVLYFFIALFTGNLTARIREQERQSRYNADRTMALYTLAHETANAVDMDEVLRTAVTQIGRVFDADVTILLPNEQHQLVQHSCSSYVLDDKEMSVANWAYNHNRPAGRDTDTLPLGTAQFLPLYTPARTVGVMGIRRRADGRMPFDQGVLLETFVNQISLVIERELLDESAEQATMLRESERLYTTLLNSISHELRTPLAAITGAASSLRDANTSAQPTARAELSLNIQDAAERLNRLVENLLDMSRLESGKLQLKREWCDIREIIAVAVQRAEKCNHERPINIDTAPDLPLIQLDFVLIEQAIANLIDNACRYTPVGTTIRIRVAASDEQMTVTIQDDGPGIPEVELARIFDKFYRVPGTAAGGTGLGLSISRGLIEAHGGALLAQNAPEGGARFTLQLPIDGSPSPVQEAGETAEAVS